MNANIMKAQIFHKMKYDLRGSQKVILNFQNHLFCDKFFVKRPIFLKLFKNVNILKTQIFKIKI